MRLFLKPAVDLLSPSIQILLRAQFKRQIYFFLAQEQPRYFTPPFGNPGKKSLLLIHIFHGHTNRNQMRSLSAHHSTSEATALVDLETER
jgi:hypothetical protein